MNKLKLKIVSCTIIFLLLIQILIPIPSSLTTYAITNDDIYDVILFWGQSNMVGSCYSRKESEVRFDPENSTEVKNYSELSGISEDILSKNSKTARNIVSIPQESETVYEYVYTQDSIKEITETTTQYGEHLIYNLSSEKLDIPEDNTIRSLSASKGTNIIPEFCRTYYEKTGHKVIAVMAAREGKPIRQFLPYNDKDNTVSDNEKELRLYESIKEKYQKAMNYLNSNNYKIGTKMYVAFQGESDVGNTPQTTNTNYYNQFMKVHNNLKNDLGIQKGAIIETARASGTYRLEAVDIIHQAQEDLIKNNSDIILGSTFFYDKYIPIESDYNNCNTKITFDSDGNKIAYQNALEKARTTEDYIDDENRNNAIHLTSAALSQIGRETAQNLANTIDTTVPQITKVTASDRYKNITNIYSDNKLQGNDNISNHWFKGVVTLKFEAKDDESGIKSYWINTDGENDENVQSKNITSTTKNIKLTVYNNADLSTSVENINVNIDNTNPTLELNSYEEKGINKWVNPEIEANQNRSCYIALNPSDEESGIKMQYKYRINDGKWQTGYTRNYKNELVYCFKQNGKYEFKIEDNAGNESNIYTINITKVDTTCPTISASGGNGKLTIKAEDAESGLSKYTIDGKTWQSWPSGETEIQINKENTIIKAGTIKVKDEAENETSWDSQIDTGVSNEEPIPKDKFIINITSEPSEMTNKPVKVTVKVNRNIIISDETKELGWKLLEDGKTLEKTFNDNNSEQITLTDAEDKNYKEDININVDNIDKSKPQVNVTYEEINDNKVKVTMVSNKELKNIENWELSESKLELSRIYESDVEETIKVQDTLGNETDVTIKISISKVDEQKEKEIVKDIKYSQTDYTDKPVTITITLNREVKAIKDWNLSEDGKQLTRTFTRNYNDTITLINSKYEKYTEDVQININNIIIKGDISGNDKIEISDLLLLKRNLIAGKKESWLLKGRAFKAGDINEDGKINIIDLLLLKRKLLTV